MKELLPRRGPRHMPSKKKIAVFWDLPNDGVCWRCEKSEFRIERAHLIDRVFDGLDVVQNLALLCAVCHYLQPIFEPGDEEDALDYAFAR